MTIAPLRRLSIREFAERYVTLPSAYTPAGEFRVRNSRYMVEPWEALADPAVRDVTVVKATQTAGSLVGDIWLTWLLRVAPAPTFLNMQTDSDAKDHATLRINELLDRCPVVKELLPVGHKGKSKRVTQELVMQSMWLIMQGANLSNLQSKSVCYSINDEIYFWQPDSLIRDARARQTAFKWQRKTYNVSQGGMVGDELDRAFLAGTQERWSWECPSCGMVQPYRWSYNNDPKERGGVKWDTNDETRPDGVWNFDALSRTVRLECRGCGEGLRDTPGTRRTLAEGSRYVVGNPSAPSSRRSFTWNALACDGIPWADLVWEWVTEVIPEYRAGNREPLQKFVQKKLAEADDEGVSWFEAQTVDNSDYRLDEHGRAPDWPEEAHRFMAIDKQIDHYWWAIRAFAADGRSRYVASGRATNDIELEEIRRRHEVRADHVAEDSGKWASEVYMHCCTYGWRTLKGEDDKSFAWKDAATGETVWRPYSEPILREPLYGMNTEHLAAEKVAEFQRGRRFKCAILCRWSNAFFKDMLQNLRSGMGLYWGIPANAPQIYLDQLQGEQRRVKVHANGKRTWEWRKVGRKGDHLRDCELMILVLAAIRGLLAGRPPSR